MGSNSIVAYIMCQPSPFLEFFKKLSWWICTFNLTLKYFHYTRSFKEQKLLVELDDSARPVGGKVPLEAVLICKILPSLSLWNHFQQLLQNRWRRRNHRRVHFTHNAVNTTYKCAVKPRLHTHTKYTIIHSLTHSVSAHECTNLPKLSW